MSSRKKYLRVFHFKNKRSAPRMGRALGAFLPEQGRTILEVLMVLVLIVIISFLGFSAYNAIIDKHKAQLIIQELENAHSYLYIQEDKSNHQWHSFPVSTAMPYPMQVLYDVNGNDYVKLEGVKKGVCESLLTVPFISCFTVDNKAMTECQDKTDMVIGFSNSTYTMGKRSSSGGGSSGGGSSGGGSSNDDDVLPMVQCLIRQDCGEDFMGYCNEQGRCTLCGSGTSFDIAREKCVPVCNALTQLTCSDETDVWCCGDGLICDTENQSCKSGEGVCWYNVSAQTQNLSANCAYRVTNTLTNDGQLTVNLTALAGMDCPKSDEYCYLAWTEGDCSATIQGTKDYPDNTILYGACIKKTTGYANISCSTTNTLGSVLTPDQRCPAGQYCYLKWTDDNCSGISATTDYSSGTFYGKCLARDTKNPHNSATCP